MIPERTELAIKKEEIDFESDTIRAALISDEIDYTPDPLYHEFVADVLNGRVAAEFDDENYSRKTVTTTPSGHRLSGHVDAEDITWEELGGTQYIQCVLIYKQVGEDDSTPEDDPIITVIDESITPMLPMDTNGSDITIAWNPSGLLAWP